MKIEEEIQSSFKDDHFKAMINIKFTANWMNNMQHKVLEPFGLSLPQYNILRILRGAAGKNMAVNSIRERMVEKSPNTTRLMDKLIDKKLIKRIRCEQDRRIVYVAIVNKGLYLLTEMDEALKNMNDFMQNISAEESEMLNKLLDKIRN